MEKRLVILSALFLAVLASGCVDSSNPGGGTLNVQRLAVSSHSIYAGQSVRVALDVANNGEIPATVNVGKKGGNIMTDYCTTVFENTREGYSLVAPHVDGTTVKLKPGNTMRLRWELQQKGDVPLYGLKCNLKFRLPFNYSVSAFRHVQVKKSREAQGSPKLDARSSPGPLFFAVETIGSSAEEGKNTFIAGEDSMDILLQLQNTREEEGYANGVIDIDEESFSIRASGPVKIKNCGVKDSDIRLFEGKSRVIKCDASIPGKEELDSPAVMSEITASIDYTYVMDLGSRHVEVKTRGN